LLPLAGVINEPIESSQPISEKLFNNICEIQAIYRTFCPNLFHITPIDIQSEVRSVRNGGLIASYFSGGIDSLYNIVETELRSRQHATRRIDHLWLVRGMDIPLSDDGLWDEVLTRLTGQYSDLFEQRLVCCATNVRQFYSQYVDWVHLGCGAVLGGLAKSVASHFDRVLIGSYGTYDQAVPAGSPPLLDPLWSCDSQDIVHFSCRVTRTQKIEAIAAFNPELFTAVRVCLMTNGGKYNCGRCEKCMRTQLQLKILGIDDSRCSFEADLSIAALKKIKFPCRKDEKYIWDFWSEVVEGSRKQPELAPYINAVKWAMRRRRMACLFNWLRYLKPLERSLRPYWRALFPGYRRRKGNSGNDSISG